MSQNTEGQVSDPAPRGALRAHRDGSRLEHDGQQLVERRREVEVEALRTARDAVPGRLAGQPQRDLGARRGRRRGDGEALVEPLRLLGAAGDLDDQ